ncbi:hypothetical protein DPMN_034591 [Dreissena polymorpha]|uniref:Uncharacterized protein n=1 Tax=Dreissena polymorpha TaxID=45954 RepID=A0A9D4MAF1_DREPO|nr:hypothetical protein DPMN_034591 [Dreissena polymorpha]
MNIIRLFCVVSVWIESGKCRVDREPKCSRFLYEEQLLEKLVRMEFNIERVHQRIESASESYGMLH